MLQQLALCREMAWVLWGVSWVAFSALLAIWRLSLTTTYLREALARERRSNSSEQRRLIGWLYTRSNQMQRELLESFLRAPTPSLSELVESTERELRVRASRPPSAPPLTTAVSDDATVELTTKDFTRHSWDSPGGPRNKR